MNRRTLVAIFALGLGFLQPLAADTDIFGYFENRFFLLQTDANLFGDGGHYKFGDYNRLRLKLKATPSEKVAVNVAVDFFTFHGIASSPLGTYGDSGGDIANDSATMDLDRAYVDLYFKHFDLSIGKQRVALGVSYIWGPLDIFNRVNILEPKEEKPGANAIKLYVPLGASSSITAILSPEDDLQSSRSGLRGQFQMAGVDLGLTYIRWGERDLAVYGLDLRGENFVGWWIESGYFVFPGREETKLAVGFDYTFPIGNGVYWLSEYFYDSSGEKDSALYDYSLLQNGDRFTLGQHYFLSMLTYNFSDFSSGSLSYIANWGDGSFYLSPSFNYDISQNIRLTSGFYFPLGNATGEFKSNKPNVFFVWVKVNF